MRWLFFIFFLLEMLSGRKLKNLLRNQLVLKCQSFSLNVLRQKYRQGFLNLHLFILPDVLMCISKTLASLTPDHALCFHRNPPRFQTSTPMRKHGPTTCLAWTPAGPLTPQLLPCSHGRTAAIVPTTPAQKVSHLFERRSTF